MCDTKIARIGSLNCSNLFLRPQFKAVWLALAISNFAMVVVLFTVSCLCDKRPSRSELRDWRAVLAPVSEGAVYCNEKT